MSKSVVSNVKNNKKMSQKDAVYLAVVNVCHEDDIPFENGMRVMDFFSKEQRLRVTQQLFDWFKSDEVELSTDFGSDVVLRSYCASLQSNWLRKDVRLNGGTPYVPKHPGMRENLGDPSIRAMRQLLSTLSDPQEQAEVRRHIEGRRRELEETRRPKVEIDYSALPAGLRSKYGERVEGRKKNVA